MSAGKGPKKRTAMKYHRGKPASMSKLALKYGIPWSGTISGKRARDGHVGQPPSIPLNLEMQIVHTMIAVRMKMSRKM